MRCLCLASLLLACLACGPTAVSVPALAPSITPESKVEASYELDFGGVANRAVCSKPADLEPLCVKGLRSAMEEGLKTALDARFGGGGKQYTARFRFLKFSHAKGDDGVELAFSWRFSLLGPDEQALFLLDAETKNTKAVPAQGSASEAIASALNGVLDHIAEDLGKADL